MSESHQITDEQLSAIRAEIFAGRKISAIKLYRDGANCDLKHAKEVIEVLEDELRVKEPEKFGGVRKSGCGATILLGVCLAGSAAGAAWMLA